ncbi:MAG: class I SAM-dependent methyltransferase [Opitutaceae bacterium]|jgi:SAM-dependent methyltransferase|nr:class I SAM-dependent methyltransferase [Opitutaceae bacterium]
MENTHYFSTSRTSGRTCGYCQNPVDHVLFKTTDIQGNTWDWSQCSACGTQSITPRPTPEQLSAAYDTSFYGTGKTRFIWPLEQLINYVHSRRAKQIARNLPKRAKVLDVGCGSGDFLAALGCFGDFELHGIELPGGSADRAAKRGNIRLKVGSITDDALSLPEHLDL